MCQSKRDGGRRCAFHLQQAAEGAVVGYSVATTGLSRADAATVLADLKVEGANAPDPARDEVDQWLEEQAFRVRYDADLSEARRESILGRIRAAIGRILPDGATFHAWKNLVAESWSRVRRKAAAAFIITAVSFGVGACGNAPAQSGEHAPAATTASAPVTPGQFDTTFETDTTPTFDASALQRWDKATVQKVTTQAVDFNDTYSFREDVVERRSDYSISDFADEMKHMDAQTAAEYKAGLEATFKDPTSSKQGDVLVVTVFNVDIPEMPLTTAGPRWVNQRTTDVTSKADPNSDSMMVSMTSKADLRVTEKGKPRLLEVTKTITYYMTKTTQDGKDVWQVTGWNGNVATHGTRPEPALAH